MFALENLKHRILYIMHLDWNWVKQRPHFIAESLASKHHVKVFYSFNPWRRQLAKNASGIARFPIFIPRVRKQSLWQFWKICTAIQETLIANMTKSFSPDIIWVTFPTLYPFIPKAYKDIPIIYDCMDNALSFPGAPYNLKILEFYESKLVNDASSVICSSNKLRSLIGKSYGAKDKVHVIRNGIAPSWVDFYKMQAKQRDIEKRKVYLDIAFIGTIAEWVDFDSLCKCLEEIPKVRFHLAGPAWTAIPDHDRLIYHGVVNHEDLLNFSKKFDAFIMPFRISPLVECFDPVKLYEYLAFGKKIISLGYAGVSHFSEFVCFYETVEELISVVRKILEQRLASDSFSNERLQFLLENTWDRRVEMIEKMIADIHP